MRKIYNNIHIGLATQHMNKRLCDHKYSNETITALRNTLKLHLTTLNATQKSYAKDEPQ